ncbi:MAG: methylenetetrahydrofolate reductase [NAD(P)H], partial [Anaerolineae bacterium]|nr:methylenetetrahydrofolate reductase [NAD(P)H] [Anaerolineae bacterium]
MGRVHRITNKYDEGVRTLSFEVFPPRTDEATAALYDTVGVLATIGPDYVSVTYGAGGSTKGRTLEVAEGIQERFDLSTMHHLTLVNQTRDELVEVIGQIRNAG